jgi:hypothetical protein
MGYEDINDHAYLQDVLSADRSRRIDLGKPLASRSRLKRWELALPSSGGETPVVDRSHQIVFDLVAGQQLLKASHRVHHPSRYRMLPRSSDALV